jgi:organic radical activating enzyme
MSLKEIRLPPRYNYIACFLTLECNLKCSYCINYYGGGNGFRKPVIGGDKWVVALNRIVGQKDLPITLQGGEPGLHPDFIRIINNIKKSLSIDILTNLSFDVDAFINRVDSRRLYRDSPYPSIRVSYHPLKTNLEQMIKKVLRMQEAGFSIGIFGILHPKFKNTVLKAQKKCQDLGIDFRTKEFLGKLNGKIFGSYRYPAALSGVQQKTSCRTSELIIGPDGSIYRCHHDLYHDFPAVGNLLDHDFKIEDRFRKCVNFGECNPCDIKIKTDRFQIYGHTSVEVKV